VGAQFNLSMRGDRGNLNYFRIISKITTEY
jgi:hypothetical protein